jgi:hypothetical protein
MLEFHEVRRWLTDTYGVGDDIARNETLVNGHWAFFIKFRHHIIYVKGDEELSWFKMKFGQEA